MNALKFSMKAGALALILAGTAHAGVSIVAHESVPVDTITQDQAKDLFMGKTSSLNGKPVSAIHQKGAVYEEFVKNVLDRSPNQMESYWARLTFTGKGEKLNEVTDDKAVIEFVQSTPNGIGYVDSATDTSGLKVLFTK